MGFDNAGRGIGIRPTADLRLSECKICLGGIFQSEPRVWASRVLPSLASGLVHCRCAEDHPDPVQTIGQPTTGGQHKYRT